MIQPGRIILVFHLTFYWIKKEIKSDHTLLFFYLFIALSSIHLQVKDQHLRVLSGEN